MLHGLASKNEPRLVLSLRPQDPIPDWITHLMVLDRSCEVAHMGPKSNVLNALRQHIAFANHAEIGRTLTSTGIIEAENTAAETAMRGDDMKEAEGNGEPIIEMRGVRVAYGDKTVLGNWKETVDGDLKEGLNWTVRRGQRWGILGPNGSGKSTLIKLINGILTPNAGAILIDGKPVGVDTKKIVSYLPERTYLNNWMKVCDIIDYFNDFYEDFDKNKAYEMLKRLGIDPSMRLRTLSKGTKEKVQLILVMSRNAKLYVLDEPIGGVDPAARDYILNTILSNYNENGTIDGEKSTIAVISVNTMVIINVYILRRIRVITRVTMPHSINTAPLI